MKYVACCSFGKDSLATVILAKRHNEPLDAVVYARVHSVVVLSNFLVSL